MNDNQCAFDPGKWTSEHATFGKIRDIVECERVRFEIGQLQEKLARSMQERGFLTM